MKFFFTEKVLRYSGAQSRIFPSVKVANRSFGQKGPVSLSVLCHTACLQTLADCSEGITFHKNPWYLATLHTPHRVLIIFLKNFLLWKSRESANHQLPCPYYTERSPFQRREEDQQDALVLGSTCNQFLDLKSEKEVWFSRFQWDAARGIQTSLWIM